MPTVYVVTLPHVTHGEFAPVSLPILPPREITIGDEVISSRPPIVVLDIDGADAAAPALPVTSTGTVVPESFSLSVRHDRIAIRAADAAGERYARGVIEQLENSGHGLRALTLRDWPTLPVRGVIEGFYGEPWSHSERLHHLEEAGRWRLNRYAYAPKDDPYHRGRWRELYPPADAERIAELARTATANGVEFVYSIHPGLSMQHSDDAEHRALAQKVRSLHALGVTRFALLLDDIPLTLQHEGDIERWGDDHRATGRAHGETCARFEREVLEPLGLGGTLIMVPTDYQGSGPSDYRTGLDETLPSTVAVWWTGDDIVVGTITDEHAASATRVYGERPLVLWDNFPVNDFDRTRAFLGPLLGRSPGLPDAGLRGIFANPMVEYHPSRFALSTVAEWAWNPRQYQPHHAAARALAAVAGDDAALVAPLVAAASTWPPSAPQYPALQRVLDAELAHVGAGGSDLDALCGGLESLDAIASGGSALRDALAPWAAAGVSAARVLRASIDLHRGHGTRDAVEDAWESLRHEPVGLARPVVRGFAEAVLGDRLLDPSRTEVHSAPPEA